MSNTPAPPCDGLIWPGAVMRATAWFRQASLSRGTPCKLHVTDGSIVVLFGRVGRLLTGVRSVRHARDSIDVQFSAHLNRTWMLIESSDRYRAAVVVHRPADRVRALLAPGGCEVHVVTGQDFIAMSTRRWQRPRPAADHL